MLRRRLFCVVTFSSSYDQLAMIRRVCLNTHNPVATDAGRFGGAIAYGVLVPNFTSNFCRNAIYILQRAWEVSDPPGLLGQLFQRSSSPLRFLLLVTEEQSDGVDYRPAEVLHATNSLLEVDARCIVRSIRNYQQHLL